MSKPTPVAFECHEAIGSADDLVVYRGHFVPYHLYGCPIMPDFRHAYAKKQRCGRRLRTAVFNAGRQPAGAFPVTVVRRRA